MAIAAAPERARYWVVPVVRGILALVPAAVITFSQNHSPEFGLLVFGLWAVVSGLITVRCRCGSPRSAASARSS